MKAMILAAGRGKRLGAISDNLPKALVPVGPKPLLQIIIERLKSSGISDLIINLHYRGEMIREFVEKNKFFGMNIEFSVEPALLDTGGSVRNVQKLLENEECFLVHNCDVYSDCDLAALVDAQRKNKSAIGTIAVIERKQSSYLLFDQSGRLLGWEMADGSKGEFASKDPQAQRLCLTGIYVLTPGIFEFMKDEPPAFPIPRTFAKAAKAGKLLQAYSIDKSFWTDVGTPESLAEVQRRVLGK